MLNSKYLVTILIASVIISGLMYLTESSVTYKNKWVEIRIGNLPKK